MDKNNIKSINNNNLFRQDFVFQESTKIATLYGLYASLEWGEIETLFLQKNDKEGQRQKLKLKVLKLDHGKSKKF